MISGLGFRPETDEESSRHKAQGRMPAADAADPLSKNLAEIKKELAELMMEVDRLLKSRLLAIELFYDIAYLPEMQRYPELKQKILQWLYGT